MGGSDDLAARIDEEAKKLMEQKQARASRQHREAAHPGAHPAVR